MITQALHPKKCNRCAALYINGIFCHETGCPNEGKQWMPTEGEWVRFLECCKCGCDVKEGDNCCL